MFRAISVEIFPETSQLCQKMCLKFSLLTQSQIVQGKYLQKFHNYILGIIIVLIRIPII